MVCVVQSPLVQSFPKHLQQVSSEHQPSQQYTRLMHLHPVPWKRLIKRKDLLVSRIVIHRSIRHIPMFLAEKNFNNNTQVIWLF